MGSYGLVGWLAHLLSVCVPPKGACRYSEVFRGAPAPASAFDEENTKPSNNPVAGRYPLHSEPIALQVEDKFARVFIRVSKPTTDEATPAAAQPVATETAHAKTLQPLVFMHGQLRALDHGRINHEQERISEFCRV
jgi:hypothetical protein